MENKDLVKSLKQLKNLGSAGAPAGDFVKKNRDILLMQIKNSSGETQTSYGIKYAWNVFESVMPANTFKFVIRPVMTAVLFFGIVFGGWAATVSASYNSLPGDKLYSVKRITEKAQLSLTSKKNKPSLQTELAGRRLEEIIKITETETINNKEERTKKAVQEFKEQVRDVKTTLEDLETEANAGGESNTVVEAAKLVDRKTTEYSDTLLKVTETVSEDVKKDVEEATDAVDDAGIKAVEVIVKKQEEGAVDMSDEEVTSKVEEKLKIVQDKVSEIEASIPEEGGGDTIVGDATKEAQEVLNEAHEALSNNDLTTVVDKLVEAKNLVDTATPEETEEIEEESVTTSTPVQEEIEEDLEAQVLEEEIEANNSSSSTLEE